MRINYISDTHTEFERPLIMGGGGDTGPLSPNNNSNSDVLVLAGDIGVKGDISWVWEAAKHYNHVIYVMGNHEFYHGDINDILVAVKENLSTLPNVHVLENESVEINGTTFHGATLWTDGGNDPYVTMTINRSMNDFRIIRDEEKKFTAQDSVVMHKETVKWLHTVTEEGDVVVTHHAPSFKSQHSRYKDVPDINCAYMSNLEELIEETKPSLWFHGHVHDNFDYTVGATNVLCNPRGYVGYEENPKFDRNMTVEV